MLVVYGTSIIGKAIISMRFKAILNIHGGIVPKYRNVHSEFWALNNKDYENIGTTIMHIDDGIDTGAIALRRNISIKREDNIFSVKEKNIRLSAELIIQALNDLFSGALKKVPQDKLAGGFYNTPGFYEIIKMVLRRRLW